MGGSKRKEAGKRELAWGLGGLTEKRLGKGSGGGDWVVFKHVFGFNVLTPKQMFGKLTECWGRGAQPSRN